MKKRKVDPWFPFWIDKWLHGSTVIELKPDERGIFVSLMALSKKDDGWVRANEGVPYLENYFCGLFNCEPELLHRTIKRCIAVGKIRMEKDGTFYMTSHENYKLSPRHQRRVENEMSGEADTMSEKADAILKKKILDKKKLNKKKEDNTTYTQIELNQLFNKWWERYPRKEDKGKGKEKWLSLVVGKKVDPQEIEDALTGYINCLNNEKTDRGYIKHAKTFLFNGNKKKEIESTWRPYIKYSDPKYKPKPEL